MLCINKRLYRCDGPEGSYRRDRRGRRNLFPGTAVSLLYAPADRNSRRSIGL